MLTGRGLFQLDDLITNAAGMMAGYGIYQIAKKLWKRVYKSRFSDILKKYKKIPQDKGESIMRLKRLVSVAAAAVLALSVSLTAFAAPSTNISGVVTVDTKDNGVDGNGNTITASLAEVPAEYQSAVADVRKPETLKALLGSAYTDTMSVVDVKDVTVADGTVFPVTIRFNVPGVTTSTKVAVLHYDTEKKAWEVVDSKAGQGTITATFNSLSPVAFVVDKSTSASTTSPQTGEHSMVVLFGAVAVVAACGAVGLSRKKRA